jgi:hypothetical protein
MKKDHTLTVKKNYPNLVSLRASSQVVFGREVVLFGTTRWHLVYLFRHLLVRSLGRRPAGSPLSGMFGIRLRSPLSSALTL